MNLICLLASVEKEPSMLDGFIGIFLGVFVLVFVMWFSMLLLGMKIRINPDPDWAKDAKKYNEELVKRRPWIVWVVLIASFGSLVGTFLWYCGGKVPSVN